VVLTLTRPFFCVGCAQTSLRSAAPPVPLFHETAVKSSPSPSPSSASRLSSEKENATPLAVLFSPARVDQRARLRINEAVIAAHCSAHKDAVAEEDAEEGPTVNSEVTTALQAMSLSTGRKRRHRSSGDGGAMDTGLLQGGVEEAEPVVVKAEVPAASTRSPRQSKRSRQGRGRQSDEADKAVAKVG
jgi:hypothetical protein